MKNKYVLNRDIVARLIKSKLVNYIYHNIVAFDQGRPLNTPQDIVNAQYLR